MADPLHQFEVHSIVPLELAGYDVSFTNSSLWMVIASFAVTILMLFGTRKQALVPGRLQGFVEMLYEFVANLLLDIAGPEARRYFPLIFTIFVFVLFGNLFGLLPGSFTYTSHFTVNFALAFMGFLLVTAIGFARHGAGYLGLFLPHGTPWWLAPIVIALEMISYCARPFTLTIRLFANMLAGHVILKIFAGFSVALMASFGILAAIGPVALNILLIGFEVFVACIQAFVFALLMSVYLNDAVNLH